MGLPKRHKRFKVKHKWDALKRAAIENKKCFIRYNKSAKKAAVKEYVVAPYSFRESRRGSVLFAYDFKDGHIKSFFRSQITGVRVSNQKFRPKWEVEITEGTAMKNIMESFYELGLISKEQSMSDFMSQGLSVERSVTEADVDPEQLKRGIEVEMEHTDDPETAKKIALDHLAEHENYYTALDVMERFLESKKDNK